MRIALALLVVLVVIAIAVGMVLSWGVRINNDLVRGEQTVNEKWAQVQNVYQRRADLIPNLVETVKGFAAQERTVLEEVTKARASVAMSVSGCSSAMPMYLFSTSRFRTRAMYSW